MISLRLVRDAGASGSALMRPPSPVTPDAIVPSLAASLSSMIIPYLLKRFIEQLEIMEKYRDSPLVKVEVGVALTCKTGFDFLLGQIPLESRPDPGRLHYLSRVTNCLAILNEIEIKEGGLALDVENRDKGSKESAEGSEVDS
ncbi:uncharacterized protein A4U43_UnF1300 [Asparagus officinalis]|uniref:Uncharacterized protein n=1 Tax=Asparagus officinalis TaxID=4686 RepID=A0A1R3L7K2_ASPOF|nr:uncharacterized protein A4U43_UnF1300 [Asparagus officinalis]